MFNTFSHENQEDSLLITKRQLGYSVDAWFLVDCPIELQIDLALITNSKSIACSNRDYEISNELRTEPSTQ
jgi:hypothetical protein